MRQALGAAALAAFVVLPVAHARAEVPAVTPRISGGSTTLYADHFDARISIEGDAHHRVARVGFSLAAACAGDPDAARFATTPEVFAVPGGSLPRAVEASVPDPSRGLVGAWKLRARALDEGGNVLARYEADLVRSFPVVWQAEPQSTRVDTSGAPGVAKMALSLVHDAPIVAVGLRTSLHDDPRLGDFVRGSELENDPRNGGTSGLTSRIERVGSTSFVAEFTFPPDSPGVELGVERIFARDARCRTAEDQIRTYPRVIATSRVPRALAVGVRFDPSALANGRVQISFRHVGPKPRTESALAGLPVPVVTVRVWRRGVASPVFQARAKAVPNSPLDERAWDGESMTTPSVKVNADVLAAIRAGVEVEVDDGGTPVRPRIERREGR